MEINSLSLILVLILCLAASLLLYFSLNAKRLSREHLLIQSQLDAAQITINALTSDVMRLTTELAADKRLSAEKLSHLEHTRHQMSEQFKNLAQEILEEKSKRFTDQNQQNIDTLLKPLNEKILEFKKRVEEVYSDETRERFALQKEIQNLASLNLKMSTEAQNLTKALKGDNKAQGNWGELVLETVLEHSGLRKGFEYDVQDAQIDAQGNRLYPDLVVHLPEKKHLVIDSKVSIAAYSRSIETDDKDLQAKELTAHVQSIRAHMNGLSAKKYQDLYGLGSIDFVLMFIPIEPAFLAAMHHQSELFQEALSKNIILVCPSTLLATVRTVAHLWRQEHQNRNALEIARQCASLYDKFVGFVSDLEDVGQRLNQAQHSYGEAYKKLSTGRGNLITSAEKVRALGVKPTKSLPNQLLLDANDLSEN